MHLDGRLIVYALWAAASVAVWGRVFINEWRTYRTLPADERRRPSFDNRLSRVKDEAFRELISDFALLLVAVACSVSLIVLILGQDVPGLRGFAIAVALGAFLGAGLVRVR